MQFPFLSDKLYGYIKKRDRIAICSTFIEINTTIYVLMRKHPNIFTCWIPDRYPKSGPFEGWWALPWGLHHHHHLLHLPPFWNRKQTLKCFVIIFPVFVSVTKRSSSCKVKKHFVCLLLASESTIKDKLGQIRMAEQPILLFFFSFLQVTLLYHSIFCFGYNFIVTLYRRQRFIR